MGWVMGIIPVNSPSLSREFLFVSQKDVIDLRRRWNLTLNKAFQLPKQKK